MRAECSRLGVAIEEFRNHARYTAGGVLPDQFGEGGFRIVALQQGSDIDGRGGLVEVGARGRDLNPADHVAADDRKQGHRAGTHMGPELLLQHLQQITFRQVHLEDRMQHVVPHVGLAPRVHRQ